jgi:glycosyltransferase involved in cell wall biosynthesis
VSRVLTPVPVEREAAHGGPLRIFVVEPRPTGGMIHYAFQLSTALAEAGADVTLVTSRGYELRGLPHAFEVEELMRLWKPVEPSAAGSARRGPLRTVGRKLRRPFRALVYVREWRRLTRYLLEQRPDVVQLGKLEFPIDGWFLRRLRREGLVLTQVCHEFERRESTGPLAGLATRLTQSAYESFSALFFHGEGARRRFASLFDVPSPRLHVVPHQGRPWIFASLAGGSEVRAGLRWRYRIGESEPVVLFFGTIMPSKGLTDLLDAFPLVLRRTPSARLVVAGFPSKFVDMAEITRRVEKLGIADAVTFDARYLPFEEVGPLLELARVVVFPYRTSTESGAVQLACAFGRPVVATTTEALRDVVEDARSGLLVEPESPEQLAIAITRILSDPELAAEMGERARHLSETRYTWEALAERILLGTEAVRA